MDLLRESAFSAVLVLATRAQRHYADELAALTVSAFKTPLSQVFAEQGRTYRELLDRGDDSGGVADQAGPSA